MENAKHCRCASRLLQDCRGILHQHNSDKYCWCYFCASTQPIGVAGSIMFLGCLSICAHTHTRLMALCPGLPGWASTGKVKPIWILLKQETVSGSGISWAIHASLHLAPDKYHAITPPLSFLQACPFCHPTNSVNAPKAKASVYLCMHALNVYGGNSWTACRRLLVLSISLLAELFDLERLSIFCAWDRERTNAVINFSSFAELIFGSQINDDALN